MIHNVHTDSKKIVVSVLMITYNHEKYIDEAIRGILMQQVDFHVELLICNDASTDNTNKVIESCILNNSSQLTITYSHHKQNIGMMANFIFGLEHCKGKYIALCEGDDYWTDPLKLQKQVDLLESNPNIAISYHRVNYLMQDGLELPETLNTSTVEKIHTLSDLARGNCIHTPSVMFRAANIADKVLKLLKTSPACDYVMHMFNALHGDIHYMPQIMATYRYHKNSVWSSQAPTKMLNNWIKVLEILIPEFDEIIKIELKKQLIRTSIYLVKEYQNIDEYENAIILLKNIISVNSEYHEYIIHEIFSESNRISQIKESWSYKIGSLILSPLKHLKKLFY